MEFRISLNGLSESNAFLRCLWAQFRARYGTLGWLYQPNRDGANRIINFGLASLGEEHTIKVSIRYSRKDSINAIVVSAHPPETNVPDGIDLSVQEAMERFREPKTFRLKSLVLLNKSLAIHSYKTCRWELLPNGFGRALLALVVKGFDRADAELECSMRLGAVLDQLAVLTNCVWTLSSPSSTVDIHCIEEPNYVYYEKEWLEGFPIVDRRLALPQRALECLDSLMADDPKKDVSVLRANRHFREARQLLEVDPQSSGDVTVALLMSALEAVSVEDSVPPPCKSCGQPVYSISKRIIELGVEHLGPGSRDFFKEHYNRRSKFLHTGAVAYSLPSMRSGSHPILDLYAREGCGMTLTSGHPHNLLEFTSFILRRYAVTRVAVDSSTREPVLLDPR